MMVEPTMPASNGKNKKVEESEASTKLKGRVEKEEGKESEKSSSDEKGENTEDGEENEKKRRPSDLREAKKKLKADSEERKRKLLELAIQEEKEDFEEYKQEILSAVPQDYKDMFGKIGFTKWTKGMTPVLILSPFDVPPGGVRDMWLSMYEKKKQRSMLDSMSFLHYWYGESTSDNYYGFLAQNKFVPYERELAKGSKGHHKLPLDIQEKVQNGNSLDAREIFKVNGYREMEEDLKLEPSQRKRGVTDFPETYELLTLDDLDIADEEEKNGKSSDNEGKNKKKNTKQKSGTEAKKKRKAEDDEDERIHPQSSKVSKGVGKHADKNQNGSSKSEQSNESTENEETKGSGKKKRGRPRKSLEENEEIARKRAKSDKEHSNDTSDDDDSKAIEEGGIVKKRRGRPRKNTDETGQNTVFSSSSLEDKSAENHSRNVHKNKREMPKREAAEKIKSRVPEKIVQKESKKFEECEKKYLTKITKWRACLHEHDKEGLEKAIESMLNFVDNFSGAFMQAYDVLGLIKQTQSFLKHSGSVTFQLFKSKLFIALVESNQHVPEEHLRLLGKVSVESLRGVMGKEVEEEGGEESSHESKDKKHEANQQCTKDQAKVSLGQPWFTMASEEDLESIDKKSAGKLTKVISGLAKCLAEHNVHPSESVIVQRLHAKYQEACKANSRKNS